MYGALSMARDFAGEARREIERAGGDVAKKWIAERARVLRDRVSASDVLMRFGHTLRYNGNKEEQISCPFHGTDKKPSARFYPESHSGPSHVWCFVCQENWDCIGLWKKCTSFDGKFTALLRDMEKTYNITPPETPRFGSYEEDERIDEAMEETMRLFGACERRLRSARRAFDMRGYLVVGSILDKLEADLADHAIDPVKAKGILQKVLDKIGEKERSCPDG